MENEKKVVKLPIPDGYEFDRVNGNEVILKRTSTSLPKVWNEIIPSLGEMHCLTASVPDGMGNAIKSLCYLVCARNVWWKQLGWKPDWNTSDGKWCIYNSNDDVRFGTFVNNNAILAFPTEEVRNQFYGAFKNLIEEAKELL